jgi:hypothetical protein
MSNKQNREPVAGVVKQPFWIMLLSSVCLYSSFVFLAERFPYDSYIYLYLALPFGIAGVFAMMWVNSFPNLKRKMMSIIAGISLSCISGIISYRAFSYLIPEIAWLFLLLIVGTIIGAYTMYLWNPELRRFLQEELTFAPQTKAGRQLLKYTLFLFPIAGALGAGIATVSRRSFGGPTFMELILGPLSWLLALAITFSGIEPKSPGGK